jgi:hypothetical protein
MSSDSYEEWRRLTCEGPRPPNKERLALLAQQMLVEDLREVLQQHDQPELDKAGNLHWRLADTLMALTNYLGSVNHSDDIIEGVANAIQRLADALYDRAQGISDPLLEFRRTSKQDAYRVWLVRMYVVKLGSSRKKAAAKLAKQYPELSFFKRGDSRDLVGSILSWRERLMDGRVPNEIRKKFMVEYREFVAETEASWLRAMVSSLPRLKTQGYYARRLKDALNSAPSRECST